MKWSRNRESTADKGGTSSAAERFAAPELGKNKPTGTAKDRETGQTLQRDALHIVNVPEDMVVSSTPFVSSRRDRCKVGGRETQSHNGDLIKISPFRKAYTAGQIIQSKFGFWLGGRRTAARSGGPTAGIQRFAGAGPDSGGRQAAIFGIEA